MGDPPTISHTEKVTATATKTTQKMGLSAHEVNIIRTAAEIHDVGMCGITEGTKGFHTDSSHAVEIDLRYFL